MTLDKRNVMTLLRATGVVDRTIRIGISDTTIDLASSL
jgi:hypothetical protein